MERRFSDDEASRIWRRAAELQSARRLPVASERADAGSAETSGIPADEIVAIAREAGIDPQFVEQALDEAAHMPAADASSEFHLVRTVAADVPTAQAAVQQVATSDPHGLRLVDIRSAGEARVLVFEVAKDWGGTLNAGALAAAPNLVSLHVLLRPAGSHVDLVFQGEPNPSLPRSVRNHDIAFGSMGGLFGGMLGGGIGFGIGLTGAVIAAPVAAGAAVLGAAGVSVMRAAQNWARRKDRSTLERLAAEVEGALRIRQFGGPPR